MMQQITKTGNVVDILSVEFGNCHDIGAGGVGCEGSTIGNVGINSKRARQWNKRRDSAVGTKPNQ